MLNSDYSKNILIYTKLFWEAKEFLKHFFMAKELKKKTP